MLNIRTIFLFDGLGAILSFLLTGFLLPLFSNVIGIPPKILYVLAAFPFVYGIFSFSCYGLAKERKPWMLLSIILANIFYSILSGALVLTYNGITVWGRGFLLIEIIVIMIVVALEWNIYKKHFK